MQAKGYSKYLQFMTVAFWFAILYKVADAIVPRCHSDPLYYTLQSPKLFHFYGWKIMIHDLVASLMTGVMELFTLLFFQFTENLGWIHILAQFMVLGCSLVLGAFLLRRWTKDPLVGLLAGFSILTFPKAAGFFVYAKGDGVMGIMAMIAAYAMYKKRKPWQVGVLIGLVPAIKLTGLYPAAIIGLITVYLNRKNPRYYLTAGFCAVAVLAPFLIRNYVAIGNPFFPGLPKLFPGRAPQAVLDFCNFYFNLPPNWGFVKSSFIDLLDGKYIFTLWIYFAYRKWKNRDSSRLSILIAALASYLVFIATNGLYQGARFFFYCFFLLGLFTFLELDELFRSKKPHFLKTNLGIAILILLAFSDSRIEAAPKMIYSNFKEILTLPMPEIIAKENVRERDLWATLPKHPTEVKHILSETTAEAYYLDPYYRLEHTALSMEGGFIVTCTEKDLEKLDSYDYFILNMESTVSNPCYDKIRKKARLLGKFPGSVSAVYEKAW